MISTRKFVVEKKLRKKLPSYKKKRTDLYNAFAKKLIEIVLSQEIEHYKNLRKPKQYLKRVHLDSSFVLVFSHNSKEDVVTFIDIDHHDNIYK